MKILVSDFDGTFFDKNYLKNIKKVNDFVEKGNIFVIATGRSINNLKVDIQDFDIKYSYLICSDGASIYDAKHNNIYSCDIDSELINPICEYLESDPNISLTLIENDNIVSGTKANSIAGKFIDKEIGNQLLEKVLLKFPQIYAYLSENYINIRNKKVSKANAVDFLAQCFNFDVNDIYTVGDSINDLEMLTSFNSFTFYHVDNKLKSVCKKQCANFSEVIDDLEKL